MRHNLALESGGEPPKKKRGRPSKADLEQRIAEAAARGETYPSPRTSVPKAPKPDPIVTGPSTQEVAPSAAPTAMMVSPTEGAVDSESSTPKKRGRPAKRSIDLKEFELEAPAAATGASEGAMEPGHGLIKTAPRASDTLPESLASLMHIPVNRMEGTQDIQMGEPEVDE